VSCERM